MKLFITIAIAVLGIAYPFNSQVFGEIFVTKDPGYINSSIFPSFLKISCEITPKYIEKYGQEIVPIHPGTGLEGGEMDSFHSDLQQKFLNLNPDLKDLSLFIISENFSLLKMSDFNPKKKDTEKFKNILKVCMALDFLYPYKISFEHEKMYKLTVDLNYLVHVGNGSTTGLKRSNVFEFAIEEELLSCKHNENNKPVTYKQISTIFETCRSLYINVSQ